MANNIEKVIKNIYLAMKEENIPLTKEDIARLRLCLKEKKDVQDIIQEIVINHSFNKDYVLIRRIED